MFRIEFSVASRRLWRKKVFGIQSGYPTEPVCGEFGGWRCFWSPLRGGDLKQKVVHLPSRFLGLPQEWLG